RHHSPPWPIRPRLLDHWPERNRKNDDRALDRPRNRRRPLHRGNRRWGTHRNTSRRLPRCPRHLLLGEGGQGPDRQRIPPAQRRPNPPSARRQRIPSPPRRHDLPRPQRGAAGHLGRPARRQPPALPLPPPAALPP